MNLESLPNELLLGLFEYLDVINLFRSFDRLNNRFDQLLFVQLQRYYLDFRSISKDYFHIFSQQYFPLINDRVISLHLSDDVETPNLPQMFLSHDYRVNQFIHLKSLVIDNTCSFDLLNEITSQCRELPSLTHLSITINNHEDPDENYRHFINNIWSLPKLTHCYLDLIYPYANWLLQMSPISTSILYLSLKDISFTSDSLLYLFQHTPQLRRLSTGRIGNFSLQQPQSIHSSLISLNTTIESSMSWMKNLFQRLPNLCHLTLQVNSVHLDGQEWEKILSIYFKNIKVFRLKMTFELFASEDLEEQVDQLLDSYQSDYWINKHQWFVQCDWWPMNTMRTALLYTLPYAFDTFHYTDGYRSKSTSPKQLDFSAYHRVHILHHINRKRDFSINWIPFPIQFENIRHLKVMLPCDDTFFSVIPTLHRLTSLHAILNQDLGYSQLQFLLDRASHLYSLSFSHLNNFSINSFNINSTSIRRMEFFQDFGYRLGYFNTLECATLARSPIASQCKIVMIDLASQSNILELIENMPHLQILHVRCAQQQQNDQYTISEINDHLIEWLQDRLPSKYTYSTIRDNYGSYHLNVWTDEPL